MGEDGDMNVSFVCVVMMERNRDENVSEEIAVLEKVWKCCRRKKRKASIFQTLYILPWYGVENGRIEG